MNDIQRSPRPADRSPRRSRKASTQLGELEFSDWYEIPVFEADEDERIEEIATTGRGPRRLMAKAKLARDARRTKRQPQWDSPMPRTPAAPRVPAPDVPATPVARAATPPQPAPGPAARATSAPATAAETAEMPAPTAEIPAPAGEIPAPVAETPAPAAETPAPAAAETVAARAGEAPSAPTTEAPSTPTATKAPAKAPAELPPPAPDAKLSPKRARTAARTKTPAAAPQTAAAPRPARAPQPAARATADEDNWMTSGPALTEESMQLDLEHENVWRRRLNNFLDRWAANEVAVAHRLDDSLERVMSSNIPKAIPEFLAAATRRGGTR